MLYSRAALCTAGIFFGCAATQETPYTLRDEIQSFCQSLVQAEVDGRLFDLRLANRQQFAAAVIAREYSLLREISTLKHYQGLDSVWFAPREIFPRYYAVVDALLEKAYNGNVPPYARPFLCIAYSRYTAYTTSTLLFDGTTIIVVGADLAMHLNDDELAAVIAHEIIHAKNRHILKKYLFGQAIAWGLFSVITAALINRYQKIGLFTLADIPPIMQNAWQQVVWCGPYIMFAYLWKSRQCEYEADRIGAQLTSPGALKSALIKHEAYEPDYANAYYVRAKDSNYFLERCIAHILHPLHKLELTHPALQDRIAALDTVLAESN